MSTFRNGRLAIRMMLMAICVAGAAGGGSQANAQPEAGPDVVLSNIPDITSYGPVGGVRAYSLGSGTCNIGTSNLEWISNGSPGYAMNAYRLHNGRLVQLGLSFAKTACCVANSPGCAGMACTASGTGLRVGCKDTYSASWNAQQTRFAPRSGINAYSGAFGGATGTTGDAIFKRLQVAEADLNPLNFPGALYFVEGVYAATGDAQAQNWLNNASYQRVNVSNFQLSLTDGINYTIPAIYAWRDYGNGVGNPDPTVEISVVDVPGEGRFFAGRKVKDNLDGTWTYTYAIYNLNSHRSGGSFSVPVQSGINITNVGFHDVNYHSGEPYDNTNWTANVEAGPGGGVTWSSPQDFAQNPNSNALRWGTMYTYWFTADRAPGNAQATLGLFRPGTPSSVTFATLGPTAIPCHGDITGDLHVNINDLLSIIGAWGPCPPGPPCVNDLNGDQQVDLTDLLTVIELWGPCQ